MGNPFSVLEGSEFISEELPQTRNLVVKPSKRGRIVLRREKAQRGGKTVVIVSGFHPKISSNEIATFAQDAKKSCGCGGTVRDREIELQGDQPSKVRIYFESIGFSVAGFS